MDKFDSLVNFRDLGGIKADNGKGGIAPKRLLRSGELFELTDHDKRVLREEYNLKYIIDLRAPDELEKRPDTMIEGTEFHHVDLFKNIRKSVTNQDTIKHEDHNVSTAIKHMHKTYKDLICDKGAAEGFRYILDILLEMKEGSAIFHCFAGKDRTGLVAAIILTILGVSREDIFKDYLLTNEQRFSANEKLFSSMSGEAFARDRGVFDVLMTVNKSYLEYAYDTAGELYGSFERFVFERIGVNEGEKQKLRALYLV